jgi:TolB-like protein/DNA-binding winged helix-turn-helix (wHTH) protein/Tfp pilus assembly protein PilF
MTERARHFYEFGPFRLDTIERRLLRDGDAIRLTPKVYDTLLVLVENHGSALEKDELMQRLWPDCVVEEGSLTRNVYVLRRVLGETSNGPQYIETLPKRGYRFIAPVEEWWEEPPELIVEERSGSRITIEEQSVPGFFAGPWKTLGLLAVGIVLTGIAVYWTAARTAKRGASPSIAVLPFVNLTGDPQNEYLGDGLTDELINTLSRIGELRVVGRTSVFQFKGKAQDLRRVGEQLRVRTVLEGSVRGAGKNVRITAQLIDVADGYQLWADAYEREMKDVVAIQEVIARAIVDSLKVRLTGGNRLSLVKRGTENIEAYHLYLKGRHSLNKRTGEEMKKAVDLFEQAIAKDPNYAAAHAALADAYTLLVGHALLPPQDAVAKARTAAAKAVSIDETLSDAHAVLGHIKYVYEWDWSGSDREFRRSLELNPGNVTARFLYCSMCLLRLGRTEEAIAEAQRARDLDPLSATANWGLGSVLYRSRAYDRAIEQLRLALEMDPNYYPAQVELGFSLIQKKMLDEAVAVLEKASSLSGGAPRALGVLGHAYALSGRKEAALELLRKLMAEPVLQPSAVAQIYLGLGERDRALTWLEKAVAGERTGLLPAVKVDPIYDSLRGDPRFTELIKRMGLDK